MKNLPLPEAGKAGLGFALKEFARSLLAYTFSVACILVLAARYFASRQISKKG